MYSFNSVSGVLSVSVPASDNLLARLIGSERSRFLVPLQIEILYEFSSFRVSIDSISFVCVGGVAFRCNVD